MSAQLVEQLQALVVERGAERVYDIFQAAEIKNCSETFLREAHKAGELKGKRVGRYLRFRASDLDAWFDALPDA
jgi:excisionase family DNA binding protein